MSLVTPVVLSGGAGTRLWPVSRAASPKQLHRLVGERTLLQQTLDRLAPGGGGPFGPAAVICNHAYAAQSRAQLADLDPPPVLITEPFGRNTAACAAVAALWKAETDPEGLILLAASDHHMDQPGPFRDAVAAAVEAARDGWIVTFGIAPSRPDTGFGYIRRGEPVGAVFEAAEFVEKPDRATAERYLADGRYSWNAGYFLFRADRMIAEMARLQPAILDACRAALAAADRSEGAIALEPDAFAACPSDSIDYAVMEKAGRIAVAPVHTAWSDLGAWSAIWEGSARDAAGNAAPPHVVLIDSEGCLVQTDGPTVAVVGGRDLVVVVKDGAVLVIPRERAQEVKAVVEALKAAGRTDLL